MEYKKTIILLVLVVFLLSIAGVSASEIDNTIASENANTIELSTDNDIKDNLQTSEENEALASTDYDEAIAQTDTEVLGADSAKYSNLAEEISHSGNITLTHKNYTYDRGPTINIREANKVIDGNGAVIDMNGSTISAFLVSASGVTIKNLTIINVNYDGDADGGVIYFTSSGTVTNCNFINNNKATTKDSYGGAVCMYSGTVENCNFVNNTATDGYGGAIWIRFGTVTNCNFAGNNATYGGAVYFHITGNVTNCNFTGNTATGDGGAVYFENSGNVTNCNFTNNTATGTGNYDGGGAVYFLNTGSVTNCNFTNNNATGTDNYEGGGAVYFYNAGSVTNCNFADNSAYRGGAVYFYSTGNVSNCNFTGNSAYRGGAVFFYQGTSSVTNCNFIDNSATLNGGAVFFQGTGNVTNCNFADNNATNGGAVYFYFRGTGSVTNCNFTNNTATRDGGAVYFYAGGSVSNCNFTNNNATRDGGAVYFYQGTGSVTNCNFTNNTATGTGNYDGGGAVYFYKKGTGSVTNCNFTNNTATNGGAVYFYAGGSVSNCNFTNNTATNGGAVYFYAGGSVSNCNFTNNNATRDGGAVYFYQGTGNVTNCNFTNNKATGTGNYDGGGAVYFYQGTGNVTNCNFVDNTASRDGGAVYFYKGTGSVTNCNFTNNTATRDGGAVYFENSGNVTNCNFADNTAYRGGAICFSSSATSCTVSNCNFTGNTATGEGGAIYFLDQGTVTNCNFVNNSATSEGSWGGAIRMYSGTVSNCNFINNKATEEYTYGGAVYFSDKGTVTNCNFTGNNATTGSAIYFHSTSATKTVSNSRFLNNRANAEALEITKNDNNITITFTGNDNLLNAIYSRKGAKVTFTNVTYWGATGITTVSATMSGSNKAAGQNITVGVVVNDKLVLNDVIITNENGTIVLDISAGENYYISARHDADSYYTEAEKTISNNTKFNVNVTSQTTTNKTVNITAKSNIYSEFMPGKLLFILPNGTQINATYAGNGTWWAVHRFADYGFYQVNALYEGLNNVTVNKGILAVIPEHTFYFLNYTINGNDNPVIELSHDFYFDPAYDATFVNGIVINRPVTIKGNGNAIDAKRQARIFYVQSANAVLENLTLKNAHSNSEGGAVYFSGTGEVTNCNFTDNTASTQGGAIRFSGSGTVTNCNFADNKATRYGGAVFFNGNGEVTNCNFTNNSARNGGAVFFNGNGDVINCNFADNTAENYGGAVYFNSNGDVINCNFTNNNATRNGGAIYFLNPGTVSNCNFTNNNATEYGGAVYFYKNGEVTDCNFTNNTASSQGGAIRFRGSGTVTNCNFTNNTASGDGGAVYFKGNGEVTNSNFVNNTATQNGGAVYFADDSTGSIINCNFTNNTATSQGGAIMFFNTGTVSNCNFTNNKATGDSSYGGAVRMSSGSVSNCNFTNNTAYGNGGAVYFSSTGTVSNCNFVNNSATGEGGWGGAIRMYSGNVSNCNFINNKATGTDSRGGAVFFNREGTVSNCNFTDNTAIYDGGAVFFNSNGEVTNCNFTNNKATGDGGAVYFNDDGEVTNCNFTKNSASSRGGAVYFSDTGNVTNCNFTDNNATRNGGSVFFNLNGSVTNCNFTDNTADYGGAVYFYSNGNVTNCNFTDNTASSQGGAIRFSSTGTVTNCNFTNNTASLRGGAVFFNSNGNVTNCNFTGNNATMGSAIYFYSTSATKTVSNSRFLNNRANAESLEVTKNDNNITITFTGNDNLLNAIYSRNDAEVTFTNVTYWGANGITTVSSTMSGSNKAAGQNITVKGVVNGKIIDKINGTDENGEIVLDDVGDYWIIVSHKGDLYYTEIAETLFTNMKLYANVTSLTTNNKTVNITAKSNIFSEVMPGKLLFILPNGTQIEATYGANGTWWAEHTFDAYGEYKVNATYVGLDNVTINNGTITINKVNSTITLENIVLDYGETKNVTVTTTGATGITAKIDGNNVTVINNYTIQIPVLDAGTYNLTVTTIPDDDHNPVTKEVNITVNRVNSTLTLDDVVLDYGESKNITVTTEGATGITAKIDGVNVTVNGYTIPISGLGAGNYTLTVTTIADKNHNNITKNATITVNKVNSTLTLDDVVLDYGETKNVTVTTTGATGITAKIDGNDVTVINNYTIQIPVLDAGTYNLTVTTIADKNHNNITKNATITVNKVNSTLTLDDVVLDYGESKNITVATEGATGITAKIDGVNVTVNDYIIPISGLGAGNYNLTVTTIADKNHNNITKNATITVNKVNSTLTLDDVVLDYGESKNITVATEGATGITAKIDGNDVTVINNYTIQIPVLDAGTYNLTVTTIADKNHNNITKNATITVNKVNGTLTVNDVVLDYGESKNITVATEGATGITAKIDGVNVTVNGYTIPISGLGAGNYTLTVTTIADENHNPVTKEANITVNKVNGTLTVNDVVLDYGESKNITVATEGATGITAKIDGVNVTVNDYIIPISGLGAGNYTLTVTTIADKNHNPVTKEANITVNKVESTLTVGDIVFDYDSEGSGDVSFTGASEVTANVINQPKAVVSVNDNKIFVSGLGAGFYTLNVTTVPDENHTAVTETAGITVNKINSTLTLDDVELDYGDSKNVTVATEGATGITAKIDGANVTVKGYTIPISGLGAGNYTLSVTTIPDDNHNPVTVTSKITVNKVESTLNVGDIVFDYDGEGSGDVSFTGASEVTANVINQPKAVVSVSGNKIFVSGLAAGTYTLNVTTVPDENHTAVTETAGITVNKINSTLTLDDVVLDYGDSKNVTVTTEGATGITAKIDGVDVTVSNYTIPISGLGAGNYTLTVTTIADKNHNPVTKEVNITVNKLSTEIILANETLDLKVGDEVTDLANLTPAGAGNLTLTSSDEDLVYIDDDGIVIGNGQGQAIITVSFAGNENYTAAENKTITVNVELNDASVSVENDTLNLKVDETSAINATIEPDTIMLKIKYTSSDDSVVTVDKNGIVTAVGEGRAIITLEVGDDEIYAKNSTTVTVTVSKINTTADVSIPENITVGDNSTVNVILPADAAGNVTVKVDGEVVDTVPVKDGNADVTIPSMSAGNHTVEIAYSGDGKYNPINETKDITVSKNDITPEIIIPSDIEFGDNATVDIKLPDDASGNVTLTVDGKEINTVPVTNGTASVKLPALDAGNHTAEIAYSGDDKYKPASKTTTISIDKDSTKITADDVTATYKVDKYLVITLKDSKGNPLANASVTVELNTIKNYTTDENGQIKIKVSNLVPKSYSAKITFAGNNNYLGSDATAKVVVKKATPKITASNKMFKTTTKNKKYTITLKNNTGKPIKNAKVYLKVNGKTYKATTNSKGKATFKITKLSKTGTFKATVTYKGNKYYNKATKKVTVKVISAFKTISKGSKAKSTVKEIQRALKNHGYYLTAYGHYLKVDGIYWDYTVKAVKQFQKAKGLKVTGKVDEKTAKKLGII